MYGLLRPRWLAVAALVAVLMGAAGLLAGEARYSPMAWLVAELFIIYAAILWATPTIPPLSTVLPEASRPPSEEQTAVSSAQASVDEHAGGRVSAADDTESRV